MSSQTVAAPTPETSVKLSELVLISSWPEECSLDIMNQAEKKCKANQESGTKSSMECRVTWPWINIVEVLQTIDPVKANWCIYQARGRLKIQSMIFWEALGQHVLMLELRILLNCLKRQLLSESLNNLTKYMVKQSHPQSYLNENVL